MFNFFNLTNYLFAKNIYSYFMANVIIYSCTPLGSFSQIKALQVNSPFFTKRNTIKKPKKLII